MKKFIWGKGVAEQVSPFSLLLSPISPADFFSLYWDRTPIFIAGPAGRFDHIMHQRDFVAALYEAKLSSPNLRFLQKSIGNREESLDYFLRKKAAWSEPQTMDQLARAFCMGTIVYVAIERSVPSVAAFGRSLLPDFKCQTSTNAYFSAGRDASAFDAHFDPQDTFILQIEGEKEWRLWESERVANPISGHPDPGIIPQPVVPADETIVMTPGDVLYVPRGTWHWPRSTDSKPSLHLTVTIVMPRPLDIINWLAEEISKDPIFRAALPFSKYQNGASEISAALNDVMDHIRGMLASPNATAMATAYMLREAMQLSTSASHTTDDERPRVKTNGLD